MRILLGIGFLLLVFGASTLWHRSEMKRLRERRAPGTVEAAPRSEPPAGWGEVVVGEGSGAAPLFVEPVEPRRSAARRLQPPPGLGGRSKPPETSSTELAAEPERQSPLDWELVVRDGDVLSRIVQVHYGRVSPELEQRLAEYNGLASPDKLRVGQTLYLPPESKLEGDSPR